jgi:ComF family protein
MDSLPALCAECRQGDQELDLARSYGVYTGPLRGLILQFKFQRRERFGARLGELLATPWKSLGELAAPLLVPVPLHPSRKRERGFNQAEVLARGLARKLGKEGTNSQAVRVETRCLRRVRPTPPQTGLSLAARRENVRGVFAVDRTDAIRDRVVVLIDDVMTTGATLSACAAPLKRVGASQVLGLTLARATSQFPDLASPTVNLPIDESEAGCT